VHLLLLHFLKRFLHAPVCGTMATIHILTAEETIQKIAVQVARYNVGLWFSVKQLVTYTRTLNTS